MDFTKKSQLQ